MNSWFVEFMETLRDPWVLLGFGAQLLFFSRWIIQWYVSERKGESTVPLSFWVISLTGGCMLLVYAIREGQPVFVLGQLIGILNYSRNIALITRKRPEPIVSAGEV